MFTNSKKIILAVAVLCSSIAQAETWSCNTGENVVTQDMGSYLLVNDKYRAHYQRSCDGNECGTRGGKIYANSGYTYTIYIVDDTPYLSVQNKWGKDATCQ